MFLVRTDTIARSQSLLGHLVMHVVGQMDRETRDRILAQAKARGGLMDLRIVIEGEPFAFGFLDDRLTDAFERAKQTALRQFVEDKLTDLQDKIRAAVEPVVAAFGQPTDDDE